MTLPVYKTLRIISSALIVLLAAVGAVITFTGTKEGLLTAAGLQNLKFFTVDSNLFLGLVCLADLALAVEDGRAAGKPGAGDDSPAGDPTGELTLPACVHPWLDRLMYMAVVAVTLTFVIVAVAFGPAVGYGLLYREANLFFHLVVPLLALVSFTVLRRARPAPLRVIPLRETALAVMPAVIYGLYYTAVLLIYGVRFPDTDWYGFAAGGVRGSVISALGVLLLTWLLALGVRLLAGGRSPRKRTRK